MSRELQPCGTYAAWQRHRLAGDDLAALTCGCREAKAAYQRTYRKLAPRSETARRKAYRRAHRRALLALAVRYPVAFGALLDEEKAKEGLS